jgi:hypothetical protein
MRLRLLIANVLLGELIRNVAFVVVFAAMRVVSRVRAILDEEDMNEMGSDVGNIYI